MDLAEILRRHWPAYRSKFGDRLLPSHRKAVAAILRCRTAALGAQVYRCVQCGRDHCAYHSCNHRACPKCGHHDATAWIAKQKTLLLPVPYFLVTFTVPAGLRAFIRSHQKLAYSLLFSQSAATLQDIAGDPKHWGVQIGFLGVLQTWTRDLRYHPHMLALFLVGCGGIAPAPTAVRAPPSDNASGVVGIRGTKIFARRIPLRILPHIVNRHSVTVSR